MNPLERLETIFGMSKAEIYEAIGILPEEFRKDYETEKRIIQQTNHTLWVTIPLEYAKLMQLKKGQKVTLIWRKESKNNNPLMLKV